MVTAMRSGPAVALFWLAMSITSSILYRAEMARHHAVRMAVIDAGLPERNPVAAEAVDLARDADHAAASYGRAVTVESLIAGDETDYENARRLVLQRSFAAYLPPDRFPGGDYGAELLANQDLVFNRARASRILAPDKLRIARERAREFALDGIARRPRFAEHHFTLEMLESTASKGTS